MKAKSLAENIFDSNLASVELLITDAKTANTLLDLSEVTKIPDNRFRRVGEAHKAYQSILHFLPRLYPTQEQKEVLGKRAGEAQGAAKGGKCAD